MNHESAMTIAIIMLTMLLVLWLKSISSKTI